MTMPPILPVWIPWWAQLALLVLALLFAVALLMMPFAVFGLKGRLDLLEAQLDDIHAELRMLAMRLPDAEPPRRTRRSPPAAADDTPEAAAARRTPRAEDRARSPRPAERTGGDPRPSRSSRPEWPGPQRAAPALAARAGRSLSVLPGQLRVGALLGHQHDLVDRRRRRRTRTGLSQGQCDGLPATLQQHARRVDADHPPAGYLAALADRQRTPIVA